jgi:hypothetical protein
MPIKPAKNPLARAANVLAHDMLSEVQALMPHLDGLAAALSGGTPKQVAHSAAGAQVEIEKVRAGLLMLASQALAVIRRAGKPDAETEAYSAFVEDLGLDWLTLLPGGNIYVDPEGGCAYVEALVRVEDDEVPDAEDEDDDLDDEDEDADDEDEDDLDDEDEDADDEDEDDLDDEDEDEDDLDDEE